jgi:chemotaxis protein MotB
MAKSRPKPEKMKVPDWVLTYADMISLLVTFFILLMTYSSMEKEVYSRMAGSMAGAFGAIADPKSLRHDALDDPPPSVENRVSEGGLRTSRKDLDRIQEQAKTMVRQPGVGSLVEIERLADGLRLRIRANTSFSSSSTRLSNETRAVLREISDLLRVHTQNLIVYGHAWEEGSPDEMLDLSAGRASAAAKYLLEKGRISEHRISVAAAGASRPLIDSRGPQAVKNNRRLEIVLMPDLRD